MLQLCSPIIDNGVESLINASSEEFKINQEIHAEDDNLEQSLAVLSSERSCFRIKCRPFIEVCGRPVQIFQ